MNCGNRPVLMTHEWGVGWMGRKRAQIAGLSGRWRRRNADNLTIFYPVAGSFNFFVGRDIILNRHSVGSVRDVVPMLVTGR